MPDHERKIVEVLVGERRQVQRAVGQVDALVGSQRRATSRRTGDAHAHLAHGNRFDHAADLAVVEPDPLVLPDLGEDLGQTARDAGRGIHFPSYAAHRRGAEHGGTGEYQCVADGKRNRVSIWITVSHHRICRGRGLLAALAGGRHHAQRVPAIQIGSLPRRCPGARVRGALDLQRARLPAQIGEFHRPSLAELTHPVARNAQTAVGCFGRPLISIRARNPDPRRGDDIAAPVPPGPPLEHLRGGIDGAGAQLRTGEVHEQPAGPIQLASCLLQVGHHPAPGVGVIVGAVDPHTVHAVRDERAHERIVARRLAGHGHHDPHAAMRGARSEQSRGMGAEQRIPLAQADGGFGDRRWLRGDLRHPRQHGEHRIERRQDVRLGATERRQPEGRQPFLQRTDVVPAQGQVVDQVAGTAAKGRVRLGQHVGEPSLEITEVGANRVQLVDGAQQVVMGGDGVGVPGRSAGIGGRLGLAARSGVGGLDHRGTGKRPLNQ